MKTSIHRAVAALVLTLPNLLAAETVELRDGTLIEGKYVGGTATTIRIEAADGVKVLETAKVLALTFTGPAPKPAAGAAAATSPPTAAPAAAAVPATPQPVTVPAGSILTIRLDSAVSSTQPQGTKFSGKLLADLAVDGKAVAKAGAPVYGQIDESKKAGRLAGKSKLEFSLSGIDIGGKIQPISTTNFAEQGKGEFRKTARNAGAGAVIGNAVDDEDNGGRKGAAIGVGVSMIKKGDAITAPAGMILEFRLSQPFQANAAQ